MRKLRGIANKVGGIYYYYFYLWKLHCAAMFLFLILEFWCIECFAYPLASFVFSITFYVCTGDPAFFVSPSFFSVRTFLESLFCLFFLYSCTARLSFVPFLLTFPLLSLLVVPPCPKVVVMTLTFYRQTKDFFFYFLHPVFLSFSFKNTFYQIWISYSPNLMSSKSLASSYCFRKIYSSTDSYPNKQGVCSHSLICFKYISHSLACLITMTPRGSVVVVHPRISLQFSLVLS